MLSWSHHLVALARRTDLRYWGTALAAVCLASWLVGRALAVAPSGLAGAATSLPEGEPPPVTVSANLSLLDVGYYLATFQAYGRAPQVLGLGWTGTHEATGTTYEPDHLVENGRRAAYLHVPWRGGPGELYLDYRLALPPAPALRLDLGLALRTSAVTHSDGVELAVLVNGEEHLRLSNATAEWRDGQLDLTPWAGQVIHLRLRFTPGPARNTAYDWTLLSEPRLVALGSAGSVPALTLAQQLAQLRAHFGTVEVSALLNRVGPDVRPTSAGPFTQEVVADSDAYLLRYEGPHGTLTYRVEPAATWPGNVTWSYRTRLGHLAGGGPAFVGASLGGADGRPHATRLLGTRLDGGSVVMRHLVEGTSTPLVLETRFLLSGKTLGVQVRQEGGPGQLASVRFGQVPLPIRQAVPVPYLTFGQVYLDPQAGLFTGAFVDWTQSGASELAPTEARYQPLTDGTRRPVRETFWLTVSPHVAEVWPNLPNPPSPFRTQLAPRVVVDIWNGSFADHRRRLELLNSYGVPGLVVLLHTWQRLGFDNGFPDVLPANDGLGGDPELIRLAEVARAGGHLIGLHENYIDFYPNATSFDPGQIALTSDGEWQKAWFNPTTGMQSFALKPHHRVSQAERMAPEIHRRYQTNATFLDVHSATPPWFHTDQDARAPGAGLLATVWTQTRQLFQLLRETHGGPVLGEGHAHFFWAGALDGVEAQLVGGELAPWWVDFDLLKIHPQMVNHGMGYLERWFEGGYERPGWATYIPPQWQLDKYRAMELAFGHAGFIPNQVWQVSDFLPSLALQEIFLMTPIQARYAASTPVAIRYLAEGQELEAGEALRLGVPPRHLYLRYATGLELWVNGSEEDWAVAGHVLPPYGFVARAPGFVARTARNPQGIVYDLAAEPGYLYVNTRTSGYLLPDPEHQRHLNPQRIPVDVGPVLTNGSLVVRSGGHPGEFTLTPIPRSATFTVTLRLPALSAAMAGQTASLNLGSDTDTELAAPPAATSSVQLVAVGPDGSEHPHPFSQQAGEVTFTTSPGTLFYRLNLLPAGS